MKIKINELLEQYVPTIAQQAQLTLPKLKAPKLGFPKLEKVND